MLIPEETEEFKNILAKNGQLKFYITGIIDRTLKRALCPVDKDFIVNYKAMAILCRGKFGAK